MKQILSIITAAQLSLCCAFSSQAAEPTQVQVTPASEQSIRDQKSNPLDSQKNKEAGATESENTALEKTNQPLTQAALLAEQERLFAEQQAAKAKQERLHTLLDFCAPCHSKNGVSKLPIYPNIAGQSAEYIHKQLSDFKRKLRNETIMATIAERLSEQDIEQLANYFGQLDSNGQVIVPIIEPEIPPMNLLAERYVRLALAVGQHQSYYIDAYYGPADWQPDGDKTPLAQLHTEAVQLIADINALTPEDIALTGRADEALNEGETKQIEKNGQTEENGQATKAQQLRKDMLNVQSRSVLAFIEILQGKTMSFDEESMALYDAVSPDLDEDDFEQALDELDDVLPGWGNMNSRLVDFNEDFVIPLDKLDQVFKAAIDESRKRTKSYIDLPEAESFTIEYVTKQPWSAYNWYKGNSFSLIQMNTDHPIHIERAIDLASHEGYPGHHVFNTLMEKHLVEGKGWVEYAIYPLYSPLSLLAEGSANYGIEVAYTQNEREQFERQILFPLAGLDPDDVEEYYQVQRALAKLSYAGNVAAKRYLDGEFSKEQAVKFLMKYALSSEQKSQQRINFFERYRAYVINYNLGQDIVRQYVEAKSGKNVQQRWQIFADLLANPKSASMMLKAKK